jgi:hypothetical protein
MKTIMVVLALSLSLFAHANPGVQTNCLDSNFNGIEVGLNHSKLQYLNRFQLLYSGASPAPAGLYPLNVGDYICFDTTATYLKHKPSNKVYVMFTSGSDYCDGGNTGGVIVDLETYVSKKLEESVVAKIGDGEVVCRK